MSVCLLYIWVQVPEQARGVETPGTGVTRSWEQCSVGAWNWTQVFCKMNTCSWLLSYFFSLYASYLEVIVDSDSHVIVKKKIEVLEVLRILYSVLIT